VRKPDTVPFWSSHLAVMSISFLAKRHMREQAAVAYFACDSTRL
jgi:hypothetical protein